MKLFLWGLLLMIVGSTCIGVTAVSKVSGSSYNVACIILLNHSWGHISVPNILSLETFKSRTELSGPSGPEPVIMVLLGLGLIGISFAGRSFLKGG